MNLPVRKGVSAAVIALALSATANAVPIYINIDGELASRSTSRVGVPIEFDESVAGTAFSAQFVVELDEFGAAEFTDTAGAYRWTYTSLPGVSGIRAQLSIGGVAIDLAPYDRSRALISALDSKGPIPVNCDSGPCASTTPDQYAVSFASIETSPVSGNAQFRSLQFTTAEWPDPLVPGSGTSLIDGTQPLSLAAILMLPSMFDSPLLDSRLAFTDSYTVCTDLCRPDYTQTTQMRITSLDRRVASVPEPGTLGLLGLGLAGTLLVRRRRHPANERGVMPA